MNATPLRRWVAAWFIADLKRIGFVSTIVAMGAGVFGAYLKD